LILVFAEGSRLIQQLPDTRPNSKKEAAVGFLSFVGFDQKVRFIAADALSEPCIDFPFIFSSF
jgi:hypothetical protein